MKTVIEEQETQVTGQAVRQEPRKREMAVPGARVQQAPKPAVVAAQTKGAETKEDCYESCLDLSALFLARG